MSKASLFFQTGFQHLLDFQAYDHMLFLFAICLPYGMKDWKRLVGLATAFTVAHSITLAAAVFGFIPLSTGGIEFLIPMSILVCAIGALIWRNGGKKQSFWLQYSIIGLFGLIHGMGFSTLLRALLGREEDVWQPLLFFNLGLEVGQILFILVILLSHFLLVRTQLIKQNNWTIFWSGAISSLAFVMMLENKFW